MRSKPSACTNTAKQAPHRLSGGQKQRVAIAGVIAMMPRCVVLDEPTAMLDPQGRREVMAVVRELNKQYGITVILITHHMDEAVQAQRVVVMHQGNVLMDGTPREIFTQVDTLRAASLTVPQTIEVLYDLDREDGETLPIDALSVTECADILEKISGVRGKPGQPLAVLYGLLFACGINPSGDIPYPCRGAQCAPDPANS